MNQNDNYSSLIDEEDDGLDIPGIGEWGEEKYKLVRTYGYFFTKGVKKKWNNLVYIDLFAGSGLSRFQHNGRIVRSSALISLAHPSPFTHYIFCEQNEEKLNALMERVARLHPDKNVTFILGDSNENINTVLNAIPKHSKENTVLSFCFVDPYSMNLHFRTIKTLGEKLLVDFLILLAFGMDANRNPKAYLSENSNKIEAFLDAPNWRDEFTNNYPTNHKGFIRFLADKYKSNMESMKYQKTEDFHNVKLETKNVSLYHLAFFSKHPLGNSFWKKSKNYSDDQQKLF